MQVWACKERAQVCLLPGLLTPAAVFSGDGLERRVSPASYRQIRSVNAAAGFLGPKGVFVPSTRLRPVIDDFLEPRGSP